MKLNIRHMIRTMALGVLTIIASLIAIYQLTQAATRPEDANPYYIHFLIITLIGLALIFSLALWRIYALIRHLRRQHSGARLSLSFALRMLLAALFPLGIIGAFSWSFLSSDLGMIFNRRVAIALEDALQLTRSAISWRANQAIMQTRQLAHFMTTMRYIDLVSEIELLRRANHAIELAQFDHQGNLVAFAHQDLTVMTVAPPDAATLSRVNEEQEFFEFSAESDDTYSIRVLSKMIKPDSEVFYLRAIYAMPTEFNTLANSVRENYQQHLSYSYLQPHITTSLLLVFGLIIALTVLSALWLSTLFGETMARPVRQLIEATRKVAGGDFSTPVTVIHNNDLGVLSNHFNMMMSALRAAEETNSLIQSQLSEQNTFLSTLLDNITAGVMTLDHLGQLQVYNHAAPQLLDCDLLPYLGKVPPAEECAVDSYGEFMAAIARCFDKEEWHQEVVLAKFSQRKIVISHGRRLPAPQQNGHGYIIVFEDVTEFQQNQRNAAWEEVARRLAHEIKNPLTPIRLQTERLQRKLTDKLTDEYDRHILQRATETIINQVDAMLQLVSDFSQYAKPIELRRQRIDINALLQDIANLYHHYDLELQLAPDVPPLLADPIQLRQVMINLTNNALEASKNGEKTMICWTTSYENGQIKVSVEDNGSGFADLSKDPFEPYVTTKPKGTGLGLAIVKKIITEHQGSIQAGPSKQLNGAKITFILPLSSE